MRTLPIVMVWLMLLMLAGFSGCDGEGIDIKNAAVSSGDDQPDGDDDDDGGDTDEPDSIILGTWIAAYSDDYVSSQARNGEHAHTARIALSRDGSAVTGQGVVYRIMSEGAPVTSKLNVRLSGTLSGSDLTLTATSASGATVYDVPSWVLRFAGRRMVGAYVATDSSGDVVRSGHALWYRAEEKTLDGTWVTGFADAGGSSSLPPRPRTGLMVMDATGSDVVGSGTFVEQRENDVALEQSFNLTAGEVDRPDLTFTLGGADLINNEMDWYAMYTSGFLVGSYAQYTATNTLARFGQALWVYSPPSVVPSAFTGRWTAAFADSDAVADTDFFDYLFTLDLRALADNEVTGSGSYFQPLQEQGAFRDVTITDAVVIGSRLQMEMTLENANEQMVWDLRVGSGIMMGSYQHLDSAGRYISRGAAQWRKESTAPTLSGTWVGAWNDTATVGARRTTQLGLMTVTGQTTDGSLTGLGALRYANGETTRRLFTLVSSTVDGRDIEVVWRGADLFGDTTWRLRQAGDNLFGVYENLNSVGNVESVGNAWWVRTSQSSSF